MRYNRTMQQRKNLPTIKIEAFEGPFDLLLELARARKINLADISLYAITNDFLAYVSENKLPVSMQADFLVVAATLMLIKMRQMLPNLSPEEEEEISALTDRVRIYQMYRKKAFDFIRDWHKQPLFPAHFWSGQSANTPVQTPSHPAVTPDDIRTAFVSVIEKTPKPIQPRAHLTVRGRTLQEWLRIFSERLTTVKDIVFQDAVRGESRQDTAVSFLALLEMARNREVRITQDSDAHLVISRFQ